MQSTAEGAHLRGGEDGEPELGLLAIVHAEALQQQGPKARPSTTSDGVKHQETLQARAIVRQFPRPVQDLINNLLADCKRKIEVVSFCVTVSCNLQAMSIRADRQYEYWGSQMQCWLPHLNVESHKLVDN